MYKDVLINIKENWFYLTMAVIAFAIVYYYFEPPPPQNIETEQATAVSGKLMEIEIEEINEENTTKHLDSTFSHKAILKDVTAGKKIFNYQTSGLANGRILIKFEEIKEKEQENKDEEKAKGDESKSSRSVLIATIINVPDVPKQYSYYGWLVNTEGEKYIPTGEFKFTDDRIINAVTSTENLTSFDRFVVTLQEKGKYAGDDYHVLEGEIRKDT